MVVVACVVAFAALFRVGQLFLVAALVWNAVVGLLLTHNVCEWPHRLQELLLYFVFICKLDSSQE